MLRSVSRLRSVCRVISKNPGEVWFGAWFDDVKCRLCSRELGYSGNTSAMLRHHRALHKDKASDNASSSETCDPTEALISMIVEDCLPFSIVDGSGFQKFVKALNPSYVAPTRQV
ncbi:hypothetical protein WMY93_007578 [Mugilogobius chulae]|uniref:Hermes trasposase DNA-binding domain-containing protein n=1 Tax=Mugilogobius chulae TaxID=88201 RepID=A0AAW0PGS0_9GOBI